MSAPPTGTVTFLFTDIEGSTKRWEHYPQQMQAALARHDAILRSSIEEHGGHVFKTMGDAFCAAFAIPHDALSAALHAQHSLQAERWDPAVGAVRVRMALHTGVAEARDGDYFGQPLNRVARLLSTGHGGQVLMSDPAYDLVRDSLPPGVSALDLGEHRLKDLIRPERIFQLTASGLPSEFPPLKSLDYRPNNLPLQPTPLIGREKETAEVTRLLRREDVRLVTLTGPAGTGKTRLGLQAGAELLDDCPDGVWFVNLAPISEPGLVVSEIAQTLGVREAGGAPLLDTLKSYLREKKLLLLLDNFEQVVEARSVVTALLGNAPGLKVLITSRVPLQVRGEKDWAVPPLALPDAQHLPSLEKLTQYEAVRLFIERAVDAKSDFHVTNENAPAVAEICARLDGLPLAIELAAARIRLLAPQAMLSRLESRLKLLTGGVKDLPARQQTLRSAIEWSYDLLSTEEQGLFRRLAVFVGGRTLEAIEAVCNAEGDLEIDVLDGVESLISQSLLRQEEGVGGESRFVMLETIHEFAREKLEESVEGDGLQREHALYFMRLAEEAEPHLTAAKQQEWLERLEEEHGNIRAALRWAREGEAGRPGPEAAEARLEVGLRLGGAIWRFWNVRGYDSEGRGQLEQLLALSAGYPTPTMPTVPTAPSAARAKALTGAGHLLAFSQGDYTAVRSLHEQSLAIRRELGDKLGIAASLNNLGLVAYSQGDYAAARSLHEQSLPLFRELGNKRGIANSLGNLGSVALNQGDYEAARSLHEQSLAIRRELEDKGGIASSLYSLGHVAYSQGDYEAARSLYEECLAIRRELGEKWGIAASLKILGNVAYSQGDYEAARSLLEQSLAIRRELGAKVGIAQSLGGLGNVAYSQGDYVAARSLLEQSLAMMRDIGAKGEIAASLVGLGGVAAGMDQPGRGARLLGAADALLKGMGAVLDADDRLPYEQGILSARSQLDEVEFEKAWAEGRAMSMEQAIEYALEGWPGK